MWLCDRINHAIRLGGIARTAVFHVVLGIDLGIAIVDKSQYCCASMA
jgi:hypothetical protein